MFDELLIVLLPGASSRLDEHMGNAKLLCDPEGAGIRLIGQDYLHPGRKMARPLRLQDVAEILPPARGYDAKGGGQIAGSLPQSDLDRRYIGLPPIGIERLGGDLNSHHPHIRQKSGP